MWIWEMEGNMGKTYLAKWLSVWRDAFIVRGGKHNDIKHAYQYQRYVVFDLARDQMDKVPYQLMEEFCDGYFFSGKYESRGKVFRPAHVAVLANFAPDEAKLSADRWDIRYIGEDTVPPPADAGADSLPAAEQARAPTAPRSFVIPSVLDCDSE